MNANDLLTRVKENLIISFNDDDNLILGFIAAAISYAEGYQNLTPGHYQENPMSAVTEEGIIMLATYFYESRDGGTGGYFHNSAAASEQAMTTINRLLSINKEWKI